MISQRHVTLAEVATINPRVTARPDAQTSVSFVPMAGVDAEAATVSGEQRTFDEVRKGYTLFENGDILVAKITPCFENGKIAQAEIPHQVGAGSTEFHVIRPDSGRVDSRYLLHFLRQPHIRALGERRMTGSGGQRRIPEAFIAGLQFPLPSIDAQRRMAAKIDSLAELRWKRRRALAMLGELERSAFLDMFGDPRFDGKEWRSRPLRELVAEFRYGTSNKSGADGRPALRIPNVVRGSLDLGELKLVAVSPSEFDRLRLINGDLLFVRTNGNPDNVGRCAVFQTSQVRGAGFAPEEYIYASYLIRVRLQPRVMNPAYLQGFMESSAGRAALRERCKTSAGQYNLNVEGLGSVSVPVPPIELQEKYAERLSEIGHLRDVHGAHLLELDALFASLRDRAFRGRL